VTDYWDAVRPTYIEQWPRELLALSFASAFLPLAPHEVDALIGYCDVVSSGAENVLDEPTLRLIESRIAGAAVAYPFGAFVRLGSRSPKDAYTGHLEGFRCQGPEAGERAVRMFAESERIHDDLWLARERGYQPVVVVREFATIPSHEEWRVFVRGKRIVGVSQYDHLHPYPTDAADLGSVRAAIDHYWGTQLRAALPMRDVVADLWVHRRPVGGSHRRGCSQVVQWSTKLIEINPFLNFTDPCLFDWRELDQAPPVDPYEIRVVGARHEAPEGDARKTPPAAVV
jgi:hypothetical protein